VRVNRTFRFGAHILRTFCGCGAYTLENFSMARRTRRPGSFCREGRLLTIIHILVTKKIRRICRFWVCKSGRTDPGQRLPWGRTVDEAVPNAWSPCRRNPTQDMKAGLLSPASSPAINCGLCAPDHSRSSRRLHRQASHGAGRGRQCRGRDRAGSDAGWEVAERLRFRPSSSATPAAWRYSPRCADRASSRVL
jgi:hypothetical protein